MNHGLQGECARQAVAMKLELAKYTCATCEHDFTAPSLGESAYGEFLLWSERGELAYLNAFEDVTYKEVDSLLKLHQKANQLKPLEQAKILRKIYGKVACDRGRYGGVFEIESTPPCSFCGGRQAKSREFLNPPKIIELDVEPLKHAYWNDLSDEKKNQLIDEELKNF